MGINKLIELGVLSIYNSVNKNEYHHAEERESQKSSYLYAEKKETGNSEASAQYRIRCSEIQRRQR